MVTDDVSTESTLFPWLVEIGAPNNASATTTARSRCGSVMLVPFAVGDQKRDGHARHLEDTSRVWNECYGAVTTFTVPVEV